MPHGVYPHGRHARKMHAHDMHTCEEQRYAYKRHSPIGCTFMGCMLVRYGLIFENSFVVLDVEAWLARDVSPSCRTNLG
jgi:hypothetical protein